MSEKKIVTLEPKVIESIIFVDGTKPHPSRLIAITNKPLLTFTGSFVPSVLRMTHS
jgi:hypothetical protein